MEFIRDLILFLFVGASTVGKLRAEIQRLELSNELANMEIANYKRLHEAAVDTVQAFGLHNRAIGMEAKVYSAELVAKTKGP